MSTIRRFDGISSRVTAPLLRVVAIMLVASACILRAGDAGSVDRGRKIYREGGSGIVAVISGTEVPASVLPCASCHGRDGRGRPEGGVRPSNLTWEDLIVDRRREPEGRRHPAYTAKLLVRAIAMGVDPAGNRLQKAMPRYRMSARDMDDLIAYLNVIGSERDLGLSDSTIETGTLLGYRSGSGGIGVAMRETIAACFDEVNQRGGIYGRRLILHAPSPIDSTPERLRAFIDRSTPFVLVGSIGAGEGEDPSAVAASSRTPLIGAVAAVPRRGGGIGEEIFYLFPGLAGECGALVRYGIRHLDAARRKGAILYAGTPAGRALALELADSGSERGWNDLRPVAFPDDPEGRRGVIDELMREGRELILSLLPPGSGEDLLRRIPAAGWTPWILAPSSLWTVEPAAIPGSLDRRILISYPLWHASVSGAREYDALSRKYHFAEGFRSYRLAALAAAKIYVEALMRAGRDLSRESLVASLRKMYEFDTGVMPPVTFGPNRSIGSATVYVARVDLGRQRMDLLGD